jgi:hypothetical protein
MHCHLVLAHHPAWRRYNGTGTASQKVSSFGILFYCPLDLRQACLSLYRTFAIVSMVLIAAGLDTDTNCFGAEHRRARNRALRHGKAAVVSVHAQRVWQPRCQVIILNMFIAFAKGVISNAMHHILRG